jgi:hypothetical protein
VDIIVVVVARGLSTQADGSLRQQQVSDVLGRSCATLAELTSYSLRDQHHGLVCLWIGPWVLSYKESALAWSTLHNVIYL